MEIGNKVRFIHSKDQGIIRRKIDEKTFEIEIEEGFLIPVLKKEIVLIAAEENLKTNQNDLSQTATKFSAQDGVFLSFDPFNDRLFSILLINDTHYTLLFSINEQTNIGVKGLQYGSLHPRTMTKITEYKLSDFDSWPIIDIQLIRHQDGENTTPTNPLVKKLKINATSFFKSKRNTPLLNKHTFLFQIDKESINIEPQKIIEQIEQPKTEIIQISKPNDTVDLHIEKLSKDHTQMQAQEILYLQIKHFELSLENALATNMEQIIFIHGSGNGILRNEIHKRLSKNKLIKYYKDAQKEKFGYGATLVQLI